MKSLPDSIQQFVKQQKTVPISQLWKDRGAAAEPSPYGSHWYRAVTAMLLSGRVAAKTNGFPNFTDINRLCKEANFNQYFFERMGKFLAAARVVQADRQGRYLLGKNCVPFWKHQGKEITRIAREAVLQLLQEKSGYLGWWEPSARIASLMPFLILFFRCFRELALLEKQIGQVMHDFCTLPEPDLRRLAANAGLKKNDVACRDWEHWLNEKGQKTMLAALYTSEWAYYAERDKTGWVMPSPLGLGVLGMGPVPAPPSLAKEFKATSNLAVFAGAGLDFDTLVPLFRYCKIKRIDQLFEFQIDPRRLREGPSTAGTELREALTGLDPLPSTLATALQTESQLGGIVAVRYLHALVKPATAEALEAIQQHPQLKGYLEPGAPAGYLLIKPRSDPGNFVHRCRKLGFQVEPL